MAYYNNYSSSKKFIEKKVLDNLKTYSYNKLLEIEKSIPIEHKKINNQTPKLESNQQQLREKQSSIDKKINEIIEKNIGSRPLDSLPDKYWNVIYILSSLGAGFWLYSLGTPIYAAFIFSFLIVGGFVSIVPASIASFFISLDGEAKQKAYDRKYNPLRDEVEKIYFKKLKLPINYFDKEDKKLDMQISKLRKKSLHYYGVMGMIHSLKSRAKRREEKAKISAFDKNARDGAQVVRNDLLRDIRNKKKWKCPYCNINDNIKDSHADHIHPVFKGGLSTPQNMVLICKSCNSKKRTSTLRSFCKSKKFNYDKICDRLELMGKDV